MSISIEKPASASHRRSSGGKVPVLERLKQAIQSSTEQKKNILIPKVGLQSSVKLVASRALGEKTPRDFFPASNGQQSLAFLSLWILPCEPLQSHDAPPSTGILSIYLWRQSPSCYANQHLSKIMQTGFPNMFIVTGTRS